MIVDNYLWAHGSFAVEGKILWFVSYRHNILCKYDMESQKSEKIIFISDTRTENDAFINIIRFRQYLILVPSYEEKIHIIDLLSGEKIYYKLPDVQWGTNLFLYAVLKDKIYLFPCEYNAIAVLKFRDTEKPEVSYIVTEYNNFCSIVQIDNVAYLVNKTNQVFVFHMYNNQLNIEISVQNSNIRFHNIEIYNKDEIILCDCNGNMYRYDTKTKKIYQILKGKEMFYSMKIVGNCLYAFPRNNANIYKIFNLKTMEEKTKTLVFHDKVNIWSGQTFSKAIYIANRIYVMNTFHQCIYEIDTKKEEIKSYYVKLKGLSEDDKKLLFVTIKDNDIVNEGEVEYETLKIFILEVENKKMRKEKNNYGEKIYNHLIGKEDTKPERNKS